MMKKLFAGLFGLFSLLILFITVTNVYMVQSSKNKIMDIQQLKKTNADCILVLGAGVWENKEPTPMLKDRLDESLRLYNEGVASKILVSGDHGQEHYDEVNIMKKYLVDAGVPSKDIFMDHAGFNTYDSMYRARDIFNVKKAIVVTQKYHLYRALYICEKLGLEAYGSMAHPYVYPGAKYRTVREWLARDKAIFTCLLNKKPKYLGEKFDIHGNGDVTNDK